MAVTAVPFFFQIDEIVEHPAAHPHYDLEGGWIPSTEPGANVNATAPPVGADRHISGIQWFFNRERIVEVSQRPANALHYKTYSVYYVGGAGFMVLNGDARTPPNHDVFHRLQFATYHNDFTAYLTNAGQHPTLLRQPQNPSWAHMLLPNTYHNHKTADSPNSGGLIGELPIFLALLAFSTSREVIPTLFPHLFQNGRCILTHAWQMPRMDRRGLVVSVYTCPNQNSAGPQSNWLGSTVQDLQQYEMGRFGKYFY